MSKKLSFSGRIRNLKLWIKRLFLFFFIPFIFIYFIVLDENHSHYIKVSGPVFEVSHNVAYYLFYPFKLIKSGFSEISEIVSARANNRALRQELEELREIKLENEILRNENVRLSELLNQAPSQNRSSIIANVIYDSTNALHNTFMLTAGRTSGIKPGMAVLSSNGELIGTISVAGKRYSRAIALTDLSSTIPVRVPGSEVQGFLKGNNSSKPIFELFNDSSFVPEVGMPIMTSGIYGTLPSGIPVGYVSKVYKNHSASIKLHSNISSVYSVRIIPFDSAKEYKNAINDIDINND